MLIEEIAKEIVIEIKGSKSCRVRGANRAKKEFNRKFYKDKNRVIEDVVEGLKESLNLKKGLNTVSKEDLFKLINAE